jgi:hypothetical protein
MKKLINIVLFCLIGLSSYAQEENVIKLNSEVTFVLSKITNGDFICKIKEINRFNKSIDILHNDLLKDKIDTNEVKLYFCIGSFGGDKKTLLIIKNGLSVPLNYKAKIKLDRKDDFESTSVSALFPNVKSIEEWQDNVAEIMLSDFTVMKN